MTDPRKVLEAQVSSAQDYHKRLRDEIAKLEKQRNKAQQELDDTIKRIDLQKQEFVAYKKKVEEELSIEHTAWHAKKDQIEALKVDVEKRATEIVKTEKQLNDKKCQLDIDKVDLDKKWFDLENLSIALATKEREFERISLDNKIKTGLLEEKSKYLIDKETKLQSQQADIDKQKQELALQAETVAMSELSCNNLKASLLKKQYELDEREKKLVLTEKEVDRVVKESEKKGQEAERVLSAHNNRIATLKEYENELELKRLQLLKASRKQKVELDIAELKKE